MPAWDTASNGRHGVSNVPTLNNVRNYRQRTSSVPALNVASNVQQGTSNSHSGAKASNVNYNVAFNDPSTFDNSAYKSPSYKEVIYNPNSGDGANGNNNNNNLQASAPDLAADGWYQANLDAGAMNPPSSGYHCYGGDVASLPSIDKWMSFNALYKMNEPTLLLSNTPQQNQYIRDAVVKVSQESKVDARLILAVIMQEVGSALSLI